MDSTSPTLINASNYVARDQYIGRDLNVNLPYNESPTEKCLRSLDFLTMDMRLESVEMAVGRTCEWLHRNREWKRWISSDRGLLRIVGKPGSGKSTLLRYALHELENKETENKALILRFFFHGRGESLQRSPLGLLRSLLYQILNKEPSALSQLVTTFQRRDRNIELGAQCQWELDELRNHLNWSIHKVLKSRRVWILVDALDECGRENVKYVIHAFDSLLNGLPARSQLRICFTCRHYPTQDWHVGFEICVEHENRQDISTYLQTRLSKFPGRTTPPLPDLINQRSNGLFIWARLVVDQVLNLELGEDMADNEVKIKETINAAPIDLDKFYLEVVRNMENMPSAWRLMQWIRGARRALTLDELRWAMVVGADPCESLQECKNLPDYTNDNAVMERRVKILSCGLVEIVPLAHTRVAQFIHQSVEDFFDKGFALDDNSRNFDIGAGSITGIAHYQISRTCIRYLAMKEISQIQSSDGNCLFPTFPLLEYATRWWMKHAQISQAKGICQKELLHDFGWPSERVVEQWVRIFQMLDPMSQDCPPTGIKLVHVASRYNLTMLLQMIVEQTDQAGINVRDIYGRTPLVYAAERGHTAAATILLENKVDVNAQDWIGESYRNFYQNAYREARIDTPIFEQSPLVYTEKRAREATEKFLLENKADLNAQGPIGASPLHWAALRGHTATVSLLLEHGADAEAKVEGGCTPLAWAIQSGAQSTVKILLQTDLDLDYKYTLPHRASENEDFPPTGDRVEFFGVDDSDLFWVPSSDLCWVWPVGAHPSLWFRLQTIFTPKDIDNPVIGDLDPERPKASTYGDRTPLLRAVELDQNSIVGMLLAKGASPEMEGCYGWSPLSLAKAKRNEAMIKLLEEH